MVGRKKGPVFRATGLPALQPDNELDAAIRDAIYNNLTEDERSKLTFSTAIVPSCYDNEERAALVEFHDGVPVFLTELTDNPLGNWQVEMGDTDISFDQHFFGFTQLYTPKGDSSATADIIAITGLDGHAYGSWRGKGNLGRMWLRDFLSKDLPYCRTIIYGYNSKLLTHGVDTIIDYGRGLIEELKKIRNTEELRKRPIFFIAHSFGGIILAHCLIKAVQAGEDGHPTVASLHKATYGILFFGIPHQGLRVDDIQKMLAGQNNHPRTALLDQIRSKSDVLALQLMDFKNLIRDRKIVSFYETGQTRQLEFDSKNGRWKRTGDFITAVDADSALLQLPDSTEDKIPLDADHSMIIKFDARNDKGYTSARNKLQQFEKDALCVVAGRFSSEPTGNVHWMVPRPVNSLFTGRSELLCRIENAFQAGRTMQTKEQKRLVIVGIGGQGKSEVCLKAASVMREDFWGVFWVDVGRPEMAKNGFIAVAKAFGSSAKSIAESLHALASTKKRWLLILDNADDPDFDYKDYIPSGSNGAVLMTSRVQECKRYSTIKHETLEGLDLGHSTQLLLKAANIEETLWPRHEQQAEEIVHLLGSHTLALIQAGAYIAQGYCRLDQYPQKYQQQRKRLLEHHPNQEQSRYRVVYATFEASAEVLSGESGQDALALLAILSMLHSSVLPLRIFKDAWSGSRQALEVHSAETVKVDALGQWHASQLPGLMGGQEDEWDNYRLMRAVSRLASLSLVIRHRSDDFNGLSMHKLMHTWAKDRVNQMQQQQAWISAGCVLALSRDQQSETWRVYDENLRPHVQSYLSLRVQDMLSYGPQTRMLAIVIKCGEVLHTMREDARLESLLEDIYQALQITPLDPSSGYLRIWGLAGMNEVCMGHSTQAVALLEHVVKVEKTTLPETHPSRLASQNNLASAYQANGQIKEAVALLEHVVKVEKTTLPETHPSRLASQHTLASAYQANGHTKEVVALLEHVVKVQETTLPETHPSQLASQHTLASAYRDNGQTKEAVALLEHVVRVEKTTLPETHPSRLASQHTLASAYQANGQTREAVALLEHVVKVEKTTLPETHPSRLASQHTLASAYQANGQTKEAVALLEYVVKARETTLPETHPFRLASQNNLASVYQDNGQTKEAVALLEHVVKARETTLPETHPSRLASQNNLASAYQATGQTKEAVALLEHVVKVEKTTLPETHPSRLASQHTLASAYQDNGQTKEAVALLEHVVKVHKTTLPKTHPSRLASQNNLASAYQDNGQTKEAVALLEHVVKVQETTLPETHPDRLASQHNLASAYQANGHTKEVVALLEYVVKVQETTLPETHPSRLASQYTLASAYQANGQTKEAVALLEHVVKVHKMTLPETPRSTSLAAHSCQRIPGQQTTPR